MIIKNTAEVKSLGQTPQRYAKLAFTAWDWGTTDASAAQDLKTTVAQNFEVLKLEDEMEERIKARSQAEWNKLYAKRAVGLSANSILLLAGAGTIVAVTFTSQVVCSFQGHEFTGKVNSAAVRVRAVDLLVCVTRRGPPTETGRRVS